MTSLPTRFHRTRFNPSSFYPSNSSGERTEYIPALNVSGTSTLPATAELQTDIQDINQKPKLAWRMLFHNNRELKKLRRQLQGKRLIKTELCVKLSLLRLFHVDHVVQNRRSALSLACHELFSCKGKEGKIYRCELPLSSKPQI